MDVAIVSITLGIATILGCIVGIIFGLIKSKQIVSSYFSYIYKKGEFDKIVKESRKAGKFNSPFIENDNIIDTIVSGGKILEQEVIDMIDVFNEVGDCDERPNWKRLS